MSRTRLVPRTASILTWALGLLVLAFVVDALFLFGSVQKELTRISFEVGLIRRVTAKEEFVRGTERLLVDGVEPEVTGAIARQLVNTCREAERAMASDAGVQSLVGARLADASASASQLV